MLKSMTGYGRCEETVNGRHITAELKSVNHKYFEFSPRVTRGYGFLEDKLKTYVQSRVARGKIDFYLSIETLEDTDVVVALEDDTLVFYGFSVSGQTDFTKAKPDPMTTFVLDTLMRSAASFGETNGMNHIRTAFPDFFDFFKQRGFAVAEDHAEAPMSLIVHYE